jgi:hypothetical protein
MTCNIKIFYKNDTYLNRLPRLPFTFQQFNSYTVQSEINIAHTNLSTSFLFVLKYKMFYRKVEAGAGAGRAASNYYSPKAEPHENLPALQHWLKCYLIFFFNYFSKYFSDHYFTTMMGGSWQTVSSDKANLNSLFFTEPWE